MLNFFRLRIKQHIFAASHSFNQLCRKPLSSMLMLFIIALALSLPALFWVISKNLEHALKQWQHSGHISLYLHLKHSELQENQLIASLKAMPEIAEQRRISAEEGLSHLTGRVGMQDVMAYLPENPLPVVIEVTPAISINNADKLKQLALKLKQLPIVEQVQIDTDWINHLRGLSQFLSSMSNFLVLLLASAVILMIANTLRLSLYHQHEEIKLMKLIGATESYILRPFLYAGMWYGFLSAVMAVFMVNILIYGFAVAIAKILRLYQMHYPFSGMHFAQILILVSFSTILGWLGARISIKRQLASIDAYN